MGIVPIKRNNVSEQVFEQIKQNILTGEWPQGTKLPSENELCKMFSVSRVPIREAIQRLGALGLVETRQGEGTYVSLVTPGTMMNSLIPMLSLDKKNMLDILEFRRIIEPESAALAAQKADQSDISDMQETLEKMRKINEAKIEFSEADLGFHLQVARATKNTIIFGSYNVIKDILINYYKKINEIMGVERAVRYHTQIFEAIKGRNSEEAKKWMKEHVETTVQDISKYYDV